MKRLSDNQVRTLHWLAVNMARAVLPRKREAPTCGALVRRGLALRDGTGYRISTAGLFTLAFHTIALRARALGCRVDY